MAWESSQLSKKEKGGDVDMVSFVRRQIRYTKNTE